MAAQTTVVFESKKWLVVEFSLDVAAIEAAVIKVNKSDYTGLNGLEPSKFAIYEMRWNVGGTGILQLYFDHTTDDEIMALSGEGFVDWTENGGFIDPASTGGTGDIVLSSAAGATYSITMKLRKKD